MRLFSSFQRRKRSHGHRHYNRPNFHADVAFDTLLPYVQQPLGPHHIRTKLYQLPVTKLRSLQKEVVDTKTYVQNSPEYKLVAINLDVAKFRLYKPVQTVCPEETPTRDFLKLDFRNKCLDAVNISNILNHKKVTSTIPAYLKNHSPPIISYCYSSPIASKIFNYKKVLQGLNTENITRNPTACPCKASEFCYNPAGHIMTGDFNIVRISKHRDILSKGSKYKKPRCFTWKQNSKLIFDSVEEYARRWAKKEDVEVDTLSEWVKSVMSLVNRRVSVLSRTMSRRHESVFDDPDVAAELAEIHEKFVVVPADKVSNNNVFVCKTHCINCLMEELGMSTMTINPTYNLTAMSKEEILFYKTTIRWRWHLEFPSQRKILTFPNCTGFLNFTRIRTSRDILRVQLSAQPSLFLRF